MQSRIPTLTTLKLTFKLPIYNAKMNCWFLYVSLLYKFYKNCFFSYGTLKYMTNVSYTYA